MIMDTSAYGRKHYGAEVIYGGKTMILPEQFQKLFSLTLRFDCFFIVSRHRQRIFEISEGGGRDPTGVAPAHASSGARNGAKNQL